MAEAVCCLELANAYQKRVPSDRWRVIFSGRTTEHFTIDAKRQSISRFYRTQKHDADSAMQSFLNELITTGTTLPSCSTNNGIHSVFFFTALWMRAKVPTATLALIAHCIMQRLHQSPPRRTSCRHWLRSGSSSHMQLADHK